MKKVFLFIALAISMASFSQAKKLTPDTKKQESQKPDDKYEFITKVDTMKCSFLYAGDDGYMISDRGFVFRSYMHCEKAKGKDVEITQIVVTDKGVLIDSKKIVQVILVDWKEKQ